MSKNRTTFRSWFTGILVCTTGALSCAVETAPPEELASTPEPIINGTDMSTNEVSAAIYHYTSGQTCDDGTPLPTGWSKRPCSGTVIRKANNHTYVLTARHCVTVNARPEGPLQTFNYLRVTTVVAPGVTPPDGPPSSAITVDGIWPATVIPGYAGTSLSSMYDGAILSVPGNLPLDGTTRLLVTFMTPSELQALNPPLDIYGYGRSAPKDCDGEVWSGAGYLRWAGQFALNMAGSTYFARTGTNSLGQAAWHGDSGGGTFYRSPRTAHVWLVGVHSQVPLDRVTNWDFGGPGLAAFIQSQLGYLYLAPYSNAYDPTSKNVGANSSAGSKLNWTYAGDSANTRVSYVNNTILINGKCVQDEGLGAAVQLHTCPPTGASVTAQKWTASGATFTTLTNGTGRCLALNGTSVISASCTGTYPTGWAFRTSP